LVLMYAGYAALAYGAVRSFVPRGPAALLAAVLIAPPILLVYAASGTAELPLLLYMLATFSLLLRWLATRRFGELHLAAITLAFAAQTKNEGLALAIIVLIATALFAARDNWRQVLPAALLGMLVLLPWLILRQGLPSTHEDYGSRLEPRLFLTNLHRLDPILRAAARQVVNVQAFGLLWPMIIPLMLFGGRGLARTPAARVLLAVLVAQAIVYLLMFVVSPWELDALLNTALDRLVLHLTPAAALLAAACWRELFGAPRGPIHEFNRAAKL
jgi:4-amino-4-deoxy-L-arabinose transferase-like glycosyltransferase